MDHMINMMMNDMKDTMVQALVTSMITEVTLECFKELFCYYQTKYNLSEEEFCYMIDCVDFILDESEKISTKKLHEMLLYDKNYPDYVFLCIRESLELDKECKEETKKIIAEYT